MHMCTDASINTLHAHTCTCTGVSAEPELTEHVIEPGDVFLILASDGIWDVMDIHQAVQLVASIVNRHNGMPPQYRKNLCV